MVNNDDLSNDKAFINKNKECDIIVILSILLTVQSQPLGIRDLFLIYY